MGVNQNYPNELSLNLVNIVNNSNSQNSNSHTNPNADVKISSNIINGQRKSCNKIEIPYLKLNSQNGLIDTNKISKTARDYLPDKYTYN